MNSTRAYPGAATGPRTVPVRSGWITRVPLRVQIVAGIAKLLRAGTARGPCSSEAVRGCARSTRLLQALAWLGCAAVMAGAGANPDWAPLFNGRDLGGWVNVNCAPGTWSVRDGMIISTGVPTGVMRTDRQFENFELEMEYRHLKTGGNAGLFVWSDPITSPGVPFARAIEVQILDGRNAEGYTSHGDVFAIHGATFKPDRPHPRGAMRCLPSERRAKPAGEWNHYRVTCSNGVIRLAVNGKEVSGGSESKPRKGYICLESEGSECHFRNLRIREWPSTNPKPDEIAPLAEGFKPLYTGVDLSGWRQEPGHAGHWRTNDWILEYDGQSEAKDKHLWTEKEFGDFVLMVDWRFRKAEREGHPWKFFGVGLRGGHQYEERISTDGGKGSGWNRHVFTVRGDRLTVVHNGKTIIENVRESRMPRRGPIALLHYGGPIEFANLFVKELD
jgi:hypothetical protein